MECVPGSTVCVGVGDELVAAGDGGSALIIEPREFACCCEKLGEVDVHLVKSTG